MQLPELEMMRMHAFIQDGCSFAMHCTLFLQSTRQSLIQELFSPVEERWLHSTLVPTRSEASVVDDLNLDDPLCKEHWKEDAFLRMDVFMGLFGVPPS